MKQRFNIMTAAPDALKAMLVWKSTFSRAGWI